MKTLVKKLRKLLSDSVVDIIIIGSYVKGRGRPTDIDIVVLSQYSKELKDTIKETTNDSHIQFVSIKDYYKSIWLTILREGFSIRHNKRLAEMMGIKPVILFKYSLKTLTNSKKVMFERAIKNFENLEKLSNRVILVPIEQSADFEDFLKNWNIDIDSQEYHLMPLIRQENL